MISLKKMRIMGILGHFWPVSGLLWPLYKCLMVLKSIFFLVLSGMSEICQKNSKQWQPVWKNANFRHFRPFLACFWPVMAPVYMLKGPNKYIFLSSV